MTDDDLATLLRHDVSREEPHWMPDVSVPLTAGRRRLRARRIAGAGAAAGMLAVAGLLAVPLVNGDEPRVLDPADRALAEYDPQVMPRTLEEHTRAVLERNVPDLGPAELHVGDGQGDELPPELYDKASGMSVTYGSEEHSWSVDLSHAKSEAEGDAEKYCAEGLTDGYYLECTVDTTPRGYVVITRLEAIKPFHRTEDGRTWKYVRDSELDTVDPDKLWFEQVVKVIKSETLVTYTRERVHAPTLAAAEAAFLTPTEHLVEIGADPELVIPEPPTDDSGCGPWTQDEGVSYSC